MSSELEELYQEVILDHSRHPRNFGELPDAAVCVHGDNPSCGDEIHLAMKFGAENDVSEVRFTGHGCAISQASASILTTKVKGKSQAEARSLLRAFQTLITDGSGEIPESLGDLRLFAGVRKFPQRVKCALLPCRAIEQALQLNAGEGRVSTESEA